MSLPEPRRQHLYRHLHSLGPRPVAEFVNELIARLAIDADAVDRVLMKYAELDRDLVGALGGHDFPAPPLWRAK